MSKTKKCKVKGNCLCCCKKANAVSHAGDNYNCMPTKIGNIETNKSWVIDSNMVYMDTPPGSLSLGFVDGSPQSDYSTGANSPSFGFNTYLWPEVISGPLHNILLWNQLNFPSHTLHWKNILSEANNQWIGGNISQNDGRQLKSQMTVLNGSEDASIFIPIYSENKVYHGPVAAPVQIGRNFPDPCNLAAALPNEYEQYIAEMQGLTSYQEVINYIIESFIDVIDTSNLLYIYQNEGRIEPYAYLCNDGGNSCCTCIYYQGQGCDQGLLSFSWWIDWKLGKSKYPPRMMDGGGECTASGPGGAGSVVKCGVINVGWKAPLPRFLFYTYELLLNNPLDHSTPVYATPNVANEESRYGYQIPITGTIDIDNDTFTNDMIEVKITKKPTNHIMVCDDQRNVRWIAGINYLFCDTNYFGELPFPGMYFDVDLGNGQHRVGSVCELDRSEYEIAPCDTDQINQLYRTKFAELTAFNKVRFSVDNASSSMLLTDSFPCGYSPIGGQFTTYEYIINNERFYEDVVSVTPDGEILYVPDLIAAKDITDGDYVISRSIPAIYDPHIIYDVTSDFDVSDIYNPGNGTNQYGLGPFNFRATSGNYSTYDYIESYKMSENFNGSFSLSETFPYYKSMLGPVVRPFMGREIDIDSKEVIGCMWASPEQSYYSLGPGSNTELNGWVSEDNVLLYCPKNREYCDSMIDATNLVEGRAADSLVFNDPTLKEITVSDITPMKILKTSVKEILLSDYRGLDNKDIFDFTNVIGVYTNQAITDSVFIQSSVADTSDLTRNIFSTAEEFYNNMQNVLLNFTPEYFSDDEGIESDDRVFLYFDYMKKGTLIHTFTGEGNAVRTGGSMQNVNYHSREFRGPSELSHCNEDNFWIEGIRGHKLSNGMWFDEVYQLSSDDISVKRFISDGQDDTLYYWKSENNIVNPRNDYNVLAPAVDEYFNLNCYFSILHSGTVAPIGTGTLELNSVYGNNTYTALNLDNMCNVSTQGYLFSGYYPYRVYNILTRANDIELRLTEFWVKPPTFFDNVITLGTPQPIITQFGDE